MGASGSTRTQQTRQQTRQETHRWVIPAALGLLVLYFVAAWTIDAIRRIPSDSSAGSAAVAFSGATAYTNALAEVTGIGLRLSSPCFEGAIHAGDVQWDALYQMRGQEELYTGAHQLVVATTTLAPPDWVEHVWTLPGVTGIDTRLVFMCPAIGGSLLGPLRMAPPAERPVVLHFAGVVAYGDALRAATDLGLRLADPCFEAALARGDAPAWHAASQQQSYGAGGNLVVAPTILTPADWLSRLAGGITPGPVVGCASS